MSQEIEVNVGTKLTVQPIIETTEIVTPLDTDVVAMGRGVETVHTTYKELKDPIVAEGTASYIGKINPDSEAPANPDNKPIWGDVSNTSGETQTYTNFLTNVSDGSGGFLPVTVPDGKSGKLSYDGTSWSFVESALPSDAMRSGGFSGTGADLNANKLDTAVFDEYEPYINTSIIEDIYDRPDKPDVYQAYLDWENKIIRLLTIEDFEQDLTVDSEDEYDRPDLKDEAIYVDANGRILARSGSNGERVDDDKVKELASPFLQVPLQPAYPPRADLPTYVESIHYWDDMFAARPTSASFPNYYSKTVLGQTTLGGYDIIGYELKPLNPTKKIILGANLHGSERLSPYILPRVIAYFLDNWPSNPLLEWARWNVHFIIIPHLNPWGYENVNRRVWETPPFPVSWTRSGTEITVTYEPGDFPTDNPNVQAEDYISAGAFGKTQVSIYSSSSSAALQNKSHVIQTKSGQYGFTVTGVDAGDISGTAMMYIGVDPNRNLDPLNPTWDSLTPSLSSQVQYGNDHVPTANDNKGSKPLSLNETKVFKQLIDDNPDASVIIDLHDGSGKYNTYWRDTDGFNVAPFEGLKLKASAFTASGINGVSSVLMNNFTTYAWLNKNIPGFEPEWSTPPTEGLNAADTTEYFRWVLNLIFYFSLKY